MKLPLRWISVLVLVSNLESLGWREVTGTPISSSKAFSRESTGIRLPPKKASRVPGVGAATLKDRHSKLRQNKKKDKQFKK